MAGNTAGPHMFLGQVGAGTGAKVNTVIAGASANLYWDADNDGVFGETGIGENTGNGAELGFTIGITTGTSYYFAFENFTIGANQGADFDIHNTDTSIQRVTVLDGSTTTFFDGADEWQVSYALESNGYADVVGNIQVGSDGNNVGGDHKNILTFTQVPEPNSTALLGLGGLALILRRRK